jgi:PAS domain S-box-containing protein
MGKPPILLNEEQRIAALRQLRILDTPREERFDRITELAVEFFKVPIVLISLVDVNRQWFKSCYGLDASETGRDVSFCAHAIAEDRTFVVEDATVDPRFADNPLVTDEPKIRFYAGQPIRGPEDALIGTFCLIDRVPRTFSERERKMLMHFGKLVETELRFTNISELSQQLLESQAKQLKTQVERDRIFTNSMDLQCIVGFNGYIQRVNPMFEKTFGFSEQELQAKPVMEFVHPDDRESTQQAIEKVALGTDVVQFNNRTFCKDGSYKWTEWNSPASEEGEDCLYATGREITERLAIQQALRDSEARFKSLVEQSPEAIVLLDVEANKFVDANENALQLFKLNREAFLNSNPVSLSPPRQADGRPSAEAAFEQINRTLAGDRAVFEWLHLRSDGQVIPCDVRLVAMPDKGRRLVRASITDVRWRYEAQAALRRAKEAAEAANRAKSEFLANMSHEIRTPMNAVLGMTELVLESELNEVQRDYLQTVLTSAESLMTIINEILDFSKIESGKLELEKFPISLREFLGDTLKFLAPRAHAIGLELTWQVARNVPDRIITDPVRLRQIIINLVGNAIKFTERGEVVVRVELKHQESEHGQLQFSVRDTGLGIPADRIEAIFDAFQQADSTTTRKFGGTGLGLAIASKLVDVMGGRVWVKSELGRGSIFSFTCNVEIPAEAPTPERQPTFHGARVLVVDDNETSREFLRERLSHWQMEVEVAGGSEWAIARIAEALQPFTVFLVDLEMSGMDGLELLRRIRKEETSRPVPAILLTSGKRIVTSESAQELAVVRQLLKPAKDSELVAAIQFALGVDERETSTGHTQEVATFDESNPKKILLAEDGLTNQKLALAMLAKWNHQVSLATNGREAVEAWRNGNFDLILMDLQMPEMDGLAATQEIRRLEQGTGKHIPIIAMTAHAMTGDREKCLAAGMDGYVSKPIKKEKLQEALREISGSRTNGGNDSAPNTQATSAVVDWPTALEVVAGNDEILYSIAEVAVEELSRLMTQLAVDAANHDITQLRKTAHSIQGTLRVFQNQPASVLLMKLQAADTRVEEIMLIQQQLEPLLRNILAEITNYRDGKR